MSTMTSFKRKRIEKWCEEVSLHLKNGTICKAVISNVAEEAICGVAVAVVSQDHRSNPILSPTDANNNVLASCNNLNAKVDSALRKATQALASNDIVYNNHNINVTGNTPMSSSNVHGNAFPVVKFAYSHYHEQRRKIDRLVQGLPVLTASGLSALDRPSSKASTEDHVPIIIVNGEEPVRSSQTRSRSSSHPRKDRSQYPGCRNSPLTPTNSNVKQLHNNNGNSQNRMESTATNKYLIQNHQSSKSALRHEVGSTRNINNFRTPIAGHLEVTVDPCLSLTANDRISRIKTAPAPNRNLHRARQRILTRRGNRILEPSSQIPLQNCWAMAELTW